MQQPAGSETDSPAEVAPPIVAAASWRACAVHVIEHGRLAVTFVDGRHGEADLRSFLKSGRVNGTVFEPLRDPEFFSRVQLHLGVPQWPNGADLPPDAMHEAIVRQGLWRPE